MEKQIVRKNSRLKEQLGSKTNKNSKNSKKRVRESLSQEIGAIYRDLKRDYGYDFNELVYGEDGFMNSVYPNGFPDFAGDVIYSEKYWKEFENWLKDVKGIDLSKKKGLTEDKKDGKVKIGDKIKIIHLSEEDNRYDGREGVVTYIDDAGQIHGTWGGLAIIPGEDEYELLEGLKKMNEDYNEGIDLSVLKDLEDEGKCMISGDNFLIVFEWRDLEDIQEALDPTFVSEDEYDTRVLDNLGIEWGFNDEYSICDKCLNVVRTSPDSYSWTAKFFTSDDGELFCDNCVHDNIDEAKLKYVEYLTNNYRRANTILSKEELENLGFKLIQADYENGWYDKHDSPSEILDRALDENPGGEFIFSISGQGQFATTFELWGRNLANNSEEEVEESIKEERERIKIPQKSQLKSILDRFDNNGNYAKQGPWKIASGGYDLSFQIYYNDLALIDGIDDGLGPTEVHLDQDFYGKDEEFSVKDLAEYVCEIYRNCKIIQENETEEIIEESKEEKKELKEDLLENVTYEIGNDLGSGYSSGSVDGVEWILSINGLYESDFACQDFFDFIVYDLEDCVKDGNLFYDGYELVIPRNIIEEDFDIDNFKSDIEMLGGDIKKFLRSDDETFSIHIDFDTNFDEEEYKEENTEYGVALWFNLKGNYDILAFEKEEDAKEFIEEYKNGYEEIMADNEDVDEWESDLEVFQNSIFDNYENKFHKIEEIFDREIDYDEIEYGDKIVKIIERLDYGF